MNALSSHGFICYQSWPLRRHLKTKFMFSFLDTFCVSILLSVLKTLWEPGLVMAWFLVTHNVMKVPVSIFRTAYSTLSFLCLWPFWTYSASQTASTCSSAALFCHWMTCWIILILLMDLDSFLFPLEEELLLETLATSGSLFISSPLIHTCVHVEVHRVEIILWSFSTEAYLYTKTTWNTCGNAWLAFDLISPVTVGVNYHMIFLPPPLDEVSFLLEDILSFKK